jgi:hypothetical protein
MGLFSSQVGDVEYGVLIDIGSGSVLAAIVASDQAKKYPIIIWSKREYSIIRQTGPSSIDIKNILTSLMNVLMALNSEGRKIFLEKTKLQRLSSLQVTIAAPWSYTATKTIAYKNTDKESFIVTEELVNELLRKASQTIEEEVSENEKINNLGLKIIAKNTLQVIANDYPIIVTGKQMAKTLKVIQVSAVAQKYLVEAVAEAQEKMLPDTDLKEYSFMLAFFQVLKSQNKSLSEYCLVDITFEATEIGIIRNGALNYCTHTPFGAMTLAREIAAALSVPVEEAYGYLTGATNTNFTQQHSEKQKAVILGIYQKYHEHLAELFVETGDRLSIPKIIYLHANLATEPFFNKQILEAASTVTNMKHVAYNVTSDLLTKNYPSELSKNFRGSNQDTALLISAQFFHNRDEYTKFEQL